MRISYRQGLVSAQADFLQIGQVNAQCVDLIVSPTPTVVALASGTKDYLISEQRTVTNAWGPFTGAATQYLYWEINPANGQLTRGASTLPVIASASEPPAVNGQMWWDQTANVMKVYNGVRWSNTLRVLAGRLQSGGILIPEPFGSQVGLNTPISAGFILTDGMGAAYKSANGEFLTTDTPLTSVDTGSLVKLDGAQIIVQANENIPKFSLVYLVGGRAALASGIPPENEAKAPIGMVTTDAYHNDAVNVVPSGKVVASEQWDWPANLWGKPVYCGPSGEVITTRPPAQKNVRVGTIVGKQSILLMLDWETEVAMAASGISGVNATAPLVKSGSPDFPILSIPRSSSVMDGFLSASDFARIPALETELANKANLNHTHVIGDVTGLAVALANKSDINHQHAIADTLGLQLALDGKAAVSHTHIVADITDFAPIITDINVRIGNKADKVVGAIAGNFASLDAGGNLNDSGRSPYDYSMVGHTHTIPEITMLQVTLDAKADIVHNHVISQVTGLQAALDDKSSIGHGHVISDVGGLQLALNAKSDVGHQHVIADTTGLQGVLDNKSNVNHTHTIAGVTGLQAELNSKSDIGHTHVIAEITGLQIVLDNKANVNHSHDISDVTGLQAALNDKSDVGHTHIIAETAGLQDELDGKAPVSHMHTLAANLSDVDVISIAPLADDYLGWNGLHWVPKTLPVIQGPQGEVGPQGIQGEVGPQGIQGEVGPQGPAGTGGTGTGFTPKVKAWGGTVSTNGAIPMVGDTPNEFWYSCALPVADVAITPQGSNTDNLPFVTLVANPMNPSYSDVGLTRVIIDGQPENNGEWLVNLRVKLRMSQPSAYNQYDGLVRIWAKTNINDAIESDIFNGNNILGTYDWKPSSYDIPNFASAIAYAGETRFLEHYVNVTWQLATNNQEIDFHIANFLSDGVAPVFVEWSVIRLTQIAPAEYQLNV